MNLIYCNYSLIIYKKKKMFNDNVTNYNDITYAFPTLAELDIRMLSSSGLPYIVMQS